MYGLAYESLLNSPLRSIKAKVELYNGSTLVNTYSYNDELQEIIIDRLGEESKFFGFGICQKVTIKLRDINREKEITTNNSFRIYFDDGSKNGYIDNFPEFYVEDIKRDENTNALTITAYDALKKADKYTVGEIEDTGYSIGSFVFKVAGIIADGAVWSDMGEEDSVFETYYESGANFEGTESLRQALNMVAEATQTIYYINGSNAIVFKSLDKTGAALLTITKQDYITLDSKGSRTLSAVVHTTELGDTVTASLQEVDATQYIRNNAFWELREDIADIVDNALAAAAGLTIAQFSCSWRGNYLLDIGDKIEIIGKDDKPIITYVLNDTITYNGGLKQQTSWSYTEGSNSANHNPTTLGEAIKQTYAKVDKANKQIDIVASEVAANAEAIAAILVDTDSISLSVSNLEKTTQEALEGANEEIANLKTSVEAQITSEDLTIAIKNELDNGVDKVATEKGFIFNNDGLTIEARDTDGNRISETATQITENGMTVFNKSDEAVLTANNSGVNAVNLHATTYLIIGNNSRFEDYGSNRTGCFWIGGGN